MNYYVADFISLIRNYDFFYCRVGFVAFFRCKGHTFNFDCVDKLLLINFLISYIVFV